MEIKKAEDEELKPSSMEKSDCLFYRPSAMFGFTDPKDDRCALKTTNSGSDKCELKTNPNGPYQMKMMRDEPDWFGCPLNTVENRIKLTRNLRKIERRELEREIERQMEKYNIVIEELPPGFAEGSTDTLFERHFMKLPSLGIKGAIKYYKPFSLSRFNRE